MKKLVSIFLLMTFFIISAGSEALAGGRYHGYKNHHYRGGGHHYKYSHHRGHYYNSNRYWTSWGVGLLTGAVISTVLYQPPRPRTVVYTSQPQVIVRSEPIVIRQNQPVAPSPVFALRQVRITTDVLNVRHIPDSGASIINQLRFGQTVDVIGAAPEWLYIKTTAGQHGWVMTRYTSEGDYPVG